MDPLQLKNNNRRLAADLNKAKLDMREMHDSHEKERQDLQDEIVRLRQLAGRILEKIKNMRGGISLILDNASAESGSSLIHG